MGKSKVVIYFESDTLTPMQVLDTVLEELDMKKEDWVTPMPLRCDPLIEVTDYSVLDYIGKEKIMEKADAWNGWMESGKQTLDMLADINESIRNYCKNTLKLTEDFPDWTSTVRQEMKNILNLLNGGSNAREAC